MYLYSKFTHTDRMNNKNKGEAASKKFSIPRTGPKYVFNINIIESKEHNRRTFTTLHT